MSKRENLYKAMEEISDESLAETAEIKLKKRMLAEEEAHTGALWRRVMGGVLTAAGVILVLGAATYQIWHQQNNDAGDTLTPGGTSGVIGQESDDMTKPGAVVETTVNLTISDSMVEAGDTTTIWVKEELALGEYWSCDGTYLEFENGAVMILIENEGPVVIHNWKDIADRIDFQNFDMIRIYIAQGAGIEESFPGGVCIAGISTNVYGEAELTENIEETLKTLESMGYVLNK